METIIQVITRFIQFTIARIIAAGRVLLTNTPCIIAPTLAINEHGAALYAGGSRPYVRGVVVNNRVIETYRG